MKSVRRDELDFVSEHRRVSRQRGQGRDHAVDLGTPRVRRNQNPHQLYSVILAARPPILYPETLRQFLSQPYDSSGLRRDYQLIQLHRIVTLGTDTSGACRLAGSCTATILTTWLSAALLFAGGQMPDDRGFRPTARGTLCSIDRASLYG